MNQNIVFFPFTHMTRHQLKTLYSFFPAIHHLPVSVDFKPYPDLQTLYEQNKIHPFFSSAETIEKINGKVEEYLSWAQLHKGNEYNLKTLFKDNPYFTSDSNVTAIKSQIKGDQGSKDASVKGEAVLKDLLFLKMAQQCDQQHEQIDLELNHLDETREALISDLRGIDAGSSDVKDRADRVSEDSGSLMTRERIGSWARCFTRAGGLKIETGRWMFVTTSEAVFDFLESNYKDVVNTLDIDKIKVHENGCENKSEWQRQFCEYLMEAVQEEGPLEKELPKVDDHCSLFGKIKLNLFSGNAINHLFNLSEKQIPVCLITLK